jgi:hypothetical protein
MYLPQEGQASPLVVPAVDTSGESAPFGGVGPGEEEGSAGCGVVGGTEGPSTGEVTPPLWGRTPPLIVEEL